MVYGFVQQSGGHIKIYSEVGQGTTVRMYFPRVEPSAARIPDDEDGPEALPEGRETVLVVEDDALVRAHVERQLVDAGYRVVTADSGAAAVPILESGVPIDLLFTDVIMPGGINGRELAERARRIRPTLPVLFTSGYTENSIVHQGRLDNGVNLLMKPYRKRQLLQKVRDILDRAQR
jgi:CheY-like chemotaxis protein